MSFIAAVQTTETEQALRVCLKKLEFTKEAIADWAKTALANRSATARLTVCSLRYVTVSVGSIVVRTMRRACTIS